MSLCLLITTLNLCSIEKDAKSLRNYGRWDKENELPCACLKTNILHVFMRSILIGGRRVSRVTSQWSIEMGKEIELQGRMRKIMVWLNIRLYL